MKTPSAGEGVGNKSDLLVIPTLGWGPLTGWDQRTAFAAPFIRRRPHNNALGAVGQPTPGPRGLGVAEPTILNFPPPAERAIYRTVSKATTLNDRFHVDQPATLRRPHSSHLAGLASDWASSDRSRRRAAHVFAPALVEHGCLPLLCWHQMEELLQHKDDELVDQRLRYLRSWPLVAWVRPSDPDSGPGSVLEVLTAEVRAAYAHPDADLLQVRDLAREGLFLVGPGSEAIPISFVLVVDGLRTLC